MERDELVQRLCEVMGSTVPNPNLFDVWDNGIERRVAYRDGFKDCLTMIAAVYSLAHAPVDVAVRAVRDYLIPAVDENLSHNWMDESEPRETQAVRDGIEGAIERMAETLLARSVAIAGTAPTLPPLMHPEPETMTHCPLDGEPLETRECETAEELQALHKEVHSVGGHEWLIQSSGAHGHRFTFHWPTRAQYEAHTREQQEQASDAQGH